VGKVVKQWSSHL